MATNARRSPAAASAPSRAVVLNIGEVLAELDAEFPQVSASKIRFLEDKGLITPQRTPAGYRKYTASDVERLRFILALQRDQYLPLKVIKDYLDAIDRGERPEDQQITAHVAPRLVSDATQAVSRSMELSELAKATGATERSLQELMSYGLIERKTRGFSETDVEIVTSCMQLARFGLDARYARMLKSAADRQMEIVERAIAPTAARRDGETQGRRMEMARELSEICVNLNKVLVRSHLDVLDRRP
ncbi:MerR family transcriptional regulator [Falsarthrobacter nasiphocae]|uniref:DNA-binding transcriptional MerR regulator n=1 Tax=Falsarthrobacter nasiphocae TaxID=189863 RepID=A0AAE3YFL6_9MICC|nr:MerR family transcriptional regulator [Falsarthrobacter nasiphocae]MDR6891342.1 DNA-binding transcriptional MerR regulator [Falsarthrobacter nasiphocae]